MAASNVRGSKKAKKVKDAGTGNQKTDFQWTDDEAELLLNVTFDYKVAKAVTSVDWESVKSKYDDILERFKAELPTEPPSEAEKERIGNGLAKDYQHKKEEVTKQILTTKLKAIRQKFRQAVDSGRRSGHGRVVLIYFELCEKVWGGSPATEQLECGVESSDLTSVADEANNVPGDDEARAEQSGNLSDVSSNDDEDDSSSKPTSAVSLSPSTIRRRRKFIDHKLCEHRQEKLKRKLPVDQQLLNYAQEDIGIKRRLVEQMEKMDEQYAKSVAGMSKNMAELSQSVREGFSFLKTMFMAPRPPVYATAPPANTPMQHYGYSTPPSSHFVHPPAPRSRSGTPSSCWDDVQQEDW